jgi:tRNA pseudouridine38-40 synthase
MMKRWKITIEYDGTDFHGWQRQEGLPTIQQSIEDALTKFCQQDIKVQTAGRTDAGVHAHGQVAHFDLDYGDRSLSGYELLKAINAHLHPRPISVIAAEEEHAEFHARFDAMNKLYKYRIIQRPAFLTFDRRAAWHIRRKLDVGTMREGVKHLLGKHDFTTFRDSECQANSPIRTLDRIDITESDYDGQGGIEIVFSVEAQSFLHHQVRNIVGTLSMVGDGKWAPDDVKVALSKCDRTKGGPTAPAAGLSLVRIDYP